MKLLLSFFAAVCTSLLTMDQGESVEAKARKLIDTALPEIQPSLDAIQPANQMPNWTVADKRFQYLKNTDKWVTKLQAKLDRVKFIVSSRLRTMSDNLNRQLKSKGFNEQVKYIRLQNKLMLPMKNPYVQMSIDNTLYTPPESQQDPSFQAFQQNLNDYGRKYAENLAQWQSGIWEENPETEKYED